MLTNVPTTSPDFPLNNLWQTVTITLFVLSMINERITNFIKLNIESVLTRLLTPTGYTALFNGRTNFKLAEDDPVAEKNRERGIINWAVICGFFVAAFCGADLVHMLQNKGELLSNQEWNGFWTWDHFLGYLLTAFFISLGSKFWHDLLDVILYTSNLKRRMTNEPELFRSGSADEVREFVELTPAQVAQVALNQHEAIFRQHPDVIDIVAGLRQVNGLTRDSLTVYLRANVPDSFPKSVPVTLTSGRKMNLSVVYVSGYGTRPTVQLKVGDTIQPDGFKAVGTLCCLLNGTDPQDGQPSTYALTCSHVLTGRKYLNIGGFVPNHLATQVFLGTDTTGIWHYGLLTQNMDIALVRIKTGITAAFTPILNLKTAYYSLTKQDVDRKLHLIILTNRGPRRAQLTALLTSELRIEYAGNQIEGMTGLIELSAVDGQLGAPTTDGDSGALVVDNQNRLVGMIVAGNNINHSYAIPMSSIVQTLAEEIPSLALQV